MARRSRKKSILEEIRETIHFLTRPKRTAPKARRRKKSTARPVNHAAGPAQQQKLKDNLEQKITKKMTDEMQKMKRQMKRELLETLTPKATGKRKHSPVAPTPPDNGTYKPQTDCTFLKTLILSSNTKGEVVVGYEVLDNSSQQAWGIDIHEGIRLGRTKRILKTKVKSRTVGSERQYYLANDQNETLYFSESYKKTALFQGKATTANCTNGLVEAIRQAYKAGFKSDNKALKL